MTVHHRPPALDGSSEAPPIVSTRHPATKHRRKSLYRAGGKRALDIGLIVLFALPVLLIIAGLALLIRRDGSSPFYRQKRIGLDGKHFHILKLRSMVVDADARLAAHLAAHPEAQLEWDHHQKLRSDPRVTPIGRFIRKTSLDELPQLWNVVRGDMSLVGPRPMMPEQKALYPASAYYRMRPGITGYWQTSTRHESGFAERAAFDTAYFRDMSLKTDVAILLRSVQVVARCTGC